MTLDGHFVLQNAKITKKCYVCQKISTQNFGNENHVKFIHHKFVVIANECYAFQI